MRFFVNFNTFLLKITTFFDEFQYLLAKITTNLQEFQHLLPKITPQPYEIQHILTETLPLVYILIRTFSKELSSEAINWGVVVFFFSDITKSEFGIVIYMLFENHLQKHFVKLTFFDDHVQNA